MFLCVVASFKVPLVEFSVEQLGLDFSIVLHTDDDCSEPVVFLSLPALVLSLTDIVLCASSMYVSTAANESGLALPDSAADVSIVFTACHSLSATATC